MRTSTEIGSAAGIIGEEKAIECYAKAGFDGWDFSLAAPFLCKHHYFTNSWIDGLYGSDYLKIARQLNQVGLDNGIVCNQSHVIRLISLSLLWYTVPVMPSRVASAPAAVLTVGIESFVVPVKSKSVPLSTPLISLVISLNTSVTIIGYGAGVVVSPAAKTSELGIIVTSIAINNIQAVIFLDFMFTYSFLYVLVVEFP